MRKQRSRTKPLQYVTAIPVIVETKENHDGIFGMRKVRMVTRREINSEEKLQKILNKSQWQNLLGILALKQAHEKDDPKQRRRAHELLAGAWNVASDLRKVLVNSTDQKWDKFDLPNFVNEELKSNRVVLWWNTKRKQFLLGILCPNYESGVFTQVIVEAGFGRGMKSCPHCGKCFWAKVAGQDYDTPKCRDAHRISRWRERRKANVTL
jgi:hypothetical protein